MFIGLIAQDDLAAHLVFIFIAQDSLAAYVLVFVLAQDGDAL